MSFPKKDASDARVAGGNAGRADGRSPNGNRPGFRTDTAISNGRSGAERVLQPWVPDSTDGIDGSLEKSSSSKGWDQFAANERLFGLKTNYDENIYTTTIDKSHPAYKERVATAEKKAREIERSAPTTAHVAEERVMDFVGGQDQGGDEEDKYSGVRRDEFSSLTSGKENRYTPPARRAPTGQATVKGAPVDPAIISSQLRVAPSKKPAATPTDEANASSDASGTDKKSSPAAAKSDPKTETKPAETKSEDKTTNAKSSEKAPSGLRPSAAARTVSPQAKEGVAAPSATSTVEADVLKSFKTFATQQRVQVDKVRTNKIKADNQVKLQELKKFASNFKLATPVPKDLISIIAKDPAKQKQIQAKAMQNAEEVKRAKAEANNKDKDAAPAKESNGKSTTEHSVPTTAAPVAENRNTSRPAGPQHPPSSAAANNRHQGARQSYGPQGYHQSFRGDRQSGQHMAGRATGHLGERLRKVEQERVRGSQQQYGNAHEMRVPPTGPANSVDPNYGRRLSAMAPTHLAAKLNPNSHEFRPNPSATSFNPNGPSTGSSPRSGVNVVEPQVVSAPQSGQLIRRKTKSIDVAKCFIIAQIKTAVPPQGRNWDDNDGLRPSYDTPPVWRQVQDKERPDSTTHLAYKEYLERLPFSGPALATPNPAHAMPQVPHQHQLPFHLQHGAHGIPRQSPHMAPMPIHPGQPGPAPHVSYGNGDDHRMMHSNSAQSFASPRMAHMPMYQGQMNSPAQMPPYAQTVSMQHYIPATPQMNQFRSFSNSPQYMGQQPGPMVMPGMPPQFVGPNSMVPSNSQMPMYPGQPQFMAPGGAPPPPIPGSNGYPSPGRGPAAAPMMMQQGSQQGQPMYGMSPGMQYQQPVYGGQHPNQMSMRGYSNPGPQQFGTSPQQMHQFGHRNGSHSYGNKNFHGHNPHQQGQGGHATSAGPQGRVTEGAEESK